MTLLRVNAGSWSEIGAGTGVDTALSGQYANGAATTQVIGSGSFATGDGVEGSSDALNRALATSTETEHEWMVQLTSAELSNGDDIDFRVVWREDAEGWRNPDTITQTPSIAVVKTPPPTPVVVSRSSGVDDTSQTGHDITLPATLDDGDMVAIFVVMAKNETTLVWPTGDGWIEVDDDDYAGNDVSYSVGYLISDGTEDGTDITVTTSAANKIAYTIYRITGADSLEAGVAVGATTTNPNPPSFSPSGGSDSYLWIAVIGVSWGETVSAGPSGYTNLTTATNADSNNAAIGTSEFENEAASDDPGTATITSNEVSIANTIAIVPVVGGGTGYTETATDDADITDATSRVVNFVRIATDDVGVTDTVSVPVEVDDPAQVFTGAVWNGGVMNVYTGSGWNDGILKTYNGSSWVP